MILLYVCFLAVGHVSFGKLLPKNTPLHICHRSDINLNSCLSQQAAPFIRSIKDGSPVLGLPAIDPFKMEFTIVEGDLDVFKIKMIMKNISLTGATGVTFNYVKFDPLLQSGDISFNIPYMELKCDYFASGRLFVIPLESSAHFNGNFTGIDVIAAFSLNTIMKKGKEYYTIHKVAFKMRIDTTKIKLNSIDPANQQQVNLIQDFFNENDRLVLDTVTPVGNEHLTEFYKQIVERVLRRVPAEQLLPK